MKKNIFVKTKRVEKDINNLLDKSKEELDKLKLAIEISQSEYKLRLENRRYWHETLRLISVTVLTSFISLFISYKLADRKLIDEKNSEFNKRFYEFNLESDNIKKRNIACALSIADFTPKDKAKALKNICDKSSLRIENSNAVDNANELYNKKSPASLENEERRKILEDGEKKITELEQKSRGSSNSEKIEINKVIKEEEAKIDRIIQSDVNLKNANLAIEKLETDIKDIKKSTDAITKNQISNFGEKSDVMWFKEGYFLVFGDDKQYRILLQYLDKKIGIQVQICKSKSFEVCKNPEYNKEWISYNKPLEIQLDGKYYKINLEAIDHAGKNPFKLAAYITIQKES